MSIINKIYIISTDLNKTKDLISKLQTTENTPPIITIKSLNAKNNNNKNKYIYTPDINTKYSNHLNIWTKIVKLNNKNKNQNFLILEDDITITQPFWESLFEYWKEVPKDWDLVHLGCWGSCEQDEIKNNLYRVINNKKDKNIFIKKNKMLYVYEPALPLGLYSYVINKNSAKKLLKICESKKYTCNLDFLIASQELNTYAVDPVITKKNYNLKSMHPSINPTDFNLYNSKYIFYNSQLDIGMTYYTFVVGAISLLAGFLGGNFKINIIEIFTFIQLIDMAHSGTDKTKVKNLLFELIIFFILVFIGDFMSKFKK